MRSSLILRCASAICFTAFLAFFWAAPSLLAQGGEPQYFAIRGTKVVPVSGPAVENATILISRGLIVGVGKDVAIPPEAWVIDGKGLIEFCDEQKLRMILAGGAEAYKVKDLLRSKDVPVILRPMLTLPPDEDDPYDRLLSQPAELAAAGVRFAIASFDDSFARRLGQNAANAVARPAV
jgi:hypothetical protein